MIEFHFVPVCILYNVYIHTFFNFYKYNKYKMIQT